MRRLAFVLLAGCAGSPNTVEIALAPSLISSLDGSTTVTALVATDTTPLDGVHVKLSVDYTDRNGTAHPIDPVEGTTDARGVFSQKITGLTWDGFGTVTVAYSDKVSASSAFTVLDRTPPKVKILPPTTDNHVGPGLPLDVQVQVSDEIGVSNVTLDSTLGIQGTRSTVVASGAQMSTLTFRLQIPQNPGVTTFDLHALASDLSGNIAVADAVTLTIDPTITISTPPPLMGTLLTDGTATALNDPDTIAASAKDGQLYVGDGAKIFQVDPTTGAVNPTAVYTGQGTIAGVAFDATADNLYFTDSQDRTGRLTWNGTAYANAVACSDSTQQRPSTPYHLVFDATLGLLTPDDNAQNVVEVATCAPATVGTSFTTNANFDAPRGIALDPNGAIYVSDQNRDRVSIVDRTTHAVTQYGTGISSPYGLEWLVGGTTPYANTLMVAQTDARIVTSLTPTNQLAAAYLRNSPIDLTFIGGTMYVLTSASANNRGRIYKVTGF
jgi:hypothetical protein